MRSYSGRHFPSFGLSIQMRENGNQNNSEYGHFSGRVNLTQSVSDTAALLSQVFNSLEKLSTLLKVCVQDYLEKQSVYSAAIDLFKVNNGNIRILCEIYTKLTIKALYITGVILVFFVSFEQDSHIVLVYSLILNM